MDLEEDTIFYSDSSTFRLVCVNLYLSLQTTVSHIQKTKQQFIMTGHLIKITSLSAMHIKILNNSFFNIYFDVEALRDAMKCLFNFV